MTDTPNVQWKLDNLEEIENLLAPFHARCRQDGDDLLIQAWGGLNTHLSPGDCLILDGDRLGILRAPADSDIEHQTFESELDQVGEGPVSS